MVAFKVLLKKVFPMKCFTSQILLMVLLCFLCLSPFNIATDAFGSNEDRNFIYEDDIIEIPDEDAASKGKPKVIKKENKVVLEKEISAGKDKGPHALSLALGYIKKGRKYEARNMLSDLYFNDAFYNKRKKIKKQLDILNEEFVFSPVPGPDSILYTVKPGDSLVKIAAKFNTPHKLIMRINHKSRSLIRVGERLKILQGEISLLVDKSDFTLTVLLNGHYVKQFPVGIGKYDKTPEDVFYVKDKLKNPVWYSPEGVFPFGHPKNLLGTRWMGFEEKEGLYGYGIHGTADPDSIGKAMSNGCIRLRNEDVEALFDFVSLKTKVVIQK
ncbi:MAG: L,D-transpeptidase family protein [Planctomycetes bacterium]|nr:L,D-transpeptidase family protein [Planctomycetota bacterium]